MVPSTMVKSPPLIHRVLGCLKIRRLVNTIRNRCSFEASVNMYQPTKYEILHYLKFQHLTLNMLTTTIVAPPSNASKWHMGFNSALKGMHEKPTNTPIIHSVYQLCMVAPTCFSITLPSSRRVPSAF